jgi:hypothetical protein
MQAPGRGLPGGRGVVGLGRGRSGGGRGRRQPKVGEDRAHETGVLHRGDETQTTAVGALLAALFGGAMVAASALLLLTSRWLRASS